MIALAFYVALIVALILVPCLVVARYFEWHAQDADRRIRRLRERRRAA